MACACPGTLLLFGLTGGKVRVWGRISKQNSTITRRRRAEHLVVVVKVRRHRSRGGSTLRHDGMHSYRGRCSTWQLHLSYVYLVEHSGQRQASNRAAQHSAVPSMIWVWDLPGEARSLAWGCERLPDRRRFHGFFVLEQPLALT